MELYLEGQEHLGRSFLQNLNLPPNMSHSKLHSSLCRFFYRINTYLDSTHIFNFCTDEVQCTGSPSESESVLVGKVEIVLIMEDTYNLLKRHTPP